MSDTRYLAKQRKIKKSAKASKNIAKGKTQFTHPRQTLLQYVTEEFFDNHIVLTRNSTFVIGTRDKDTSTGIICDDSAIPRLISMVAADRNDNVPAGRNKTSRKHFQFLEWKNGSETARFEGTLEYSLAVYNTLNDPAMKLYINHLERAWPITSRTDFAVDDSDSEIEEPNSEIDH